MMDKVRVTKKFRFEMAHALENYDGLCQYIHGHSYILWVTINGAVNNDKKLTNYGMVVDFSELKRWINQSIIQKFDHSLVLRKDSNYLINGSWQEKNKNIICVDFQPTCENLLIYFKNEINKKLPQEVELFALKLSETSTSFAEWFKNDQ